MTRAMWLGFLFFVALVILGFGTLIIGNIKLGQTHAMTVHFDRVEGLKSGDDVRVEGVQLGKVKRISLDPRGGVLVLIELDHPVDIHEGYEIWVESFSVLGGNFVSIQRGNLQARRLDTAEVLRGKARTSPLEAVSELADDNRESLKELLVNLRDLTSAMRENKGSLGKLINEPTAHDELVKLLQDGRKAVEDLRLLTKTYVDELKQGEGPLRALLSDKNMADQIRQITTNLTETTEALKRITTKVESGEGLAGTLLHDKDSGERLKRTIENIEVTTDKLRQITANAEKSTIGKLFQEDGLYDKAEKTLDDMDKLLGRAARSKVWITTDARYFDKSDHSIAKLGIRIEPDETKYFFAGAAFINLESSADVIVFEDQIEQGDDQTIIRPEIGLAYRIPWFLDHRITVKAGLLEGKPGGAVEVLWEDFGIFEHPVLFSFEIRDAYNDLEDEDFDENISGPMTRFFLKTPLWRRGDEWWQKLLSAVHLTAGVSRIQDDPELFIGIGLEWQDEDIRTLVSLVGLGR
jgi:phospholipid/cholesterol/gamma-HCH transport system substrate-binding protein